jgi:hypothetical protein
MKKISPDQICFGLSRQLDEQSFSCFLQLAGQPEVAETLSSRLSTEEINSFVTIFTDLLKKHFSGSEYHTLFLQQSSHSPTVSEIKE